MRPEDIRRQGTALREKVAQEVDTTERLEMMVRAHRRSRNLAWAAAAAVVITVIVSAVLLAGFEEGPIVTTPPPTVPDTTNELRGLPVQVYLVVTDYSVDTDESCQGAGPVAGIREGSTAYLYDETLESPEDGTPITLPAGEQILAEDPRASFLLSADDTSGCVFGVPDPGFAIDDYGRIGLFHESDPNIGYSRNLSGQRVIFRFAEPSDEFDDGGFEALDGDAPDDPALLQAELDALRDSAGPGRIVGFVHLAGEDSSGPPGGPTQPVCTGAGSFDHVHPAQSVTVVDESFETIGQDILRGSAYEASIGCTLWFGVDVPTDLEVYLLHVAGRPPIILERALLQGYGWRVNLWSDPDSMTANCLEVDPVEPMTCILLEEQQ